MQNLAPNFSSVIGCGAQTLRFEGGIMAYKGLSLEGKKALIFGGTSGLGRSIALGFAEAGADVAAVSRHADAVAKTAAEIRKLGPKALMRT